MTGTANAFTKLDADGTDQARDNSCTFPRLLAERARLQARRVALQEKRYGIWQPLTWHDWYERVRDLAHGLASMGLGRGDVVAVIGDNRPEWLIAEFAAQSLGAAIVGIEPHSSGEQIVQVLDVAEVRLAVVEGQEQVDVLLGRAPQLPLLAAVVYYEPHGLEQYTEPHLHEFTELERQGRAWGRDNPRWLDARLDEISPDDVALLATTSSAGAPPKLPELTHRGLLAAAERVNEIDPVEAGDRYVCLRGLDAIEEQTLGVARSLTRGICLSFPEQPATQRADLREIGPDVVNASSQLWESMLTEVQQRLAEAGWLKRTVFSWGYRLGERTARRRRRHSEMLARLAHRIADWLALRPVRDHLGLSRTRQCFVNVGTLSPQVLGFFHAIGVNLKQTYAKAELGGIVALQRDGDDTVATVGVPLRGIEVEFSDRAEILLRNEIPFGKHKRLGDAAAAERDAQCWWYTDDVGEFDGAGRLVVLGRRDGVVQPADGQRYARAFIEATLRFSPHISTAVIVGEPLPDGGVNALVTIDAQSVAAWAQREQLALDSYSQLTARGEVRQLISDEIDHANRELPDAVRVRRFAVLHRQLEPDEVTSAGEPRRAVIASRFAPLIDAMQRGDETDEPPPWQTSGSTVPPIRPAWKR